MQPPWENMHFKMQLRSRDFVVVPPLRVQRPPLLGIEEGRLDEPDGGFVDVAKESHDAEDVEDLGSRFFSGVVSFTGMS